MRITTAGAEAVQLIKNAEGFYSKPYICPAGVATVGYGTTRYPNGNRVGINDKSIDESTALVYLSHDLKVFEQGVDALTRDDVNQNQFGALVSFAYNLGLTNLKNSTLLKKVNANPNDATIRAEFMRWNKANGKVMNGLTRRRAAESALYFS